MLERGGLFVALVGALALHAGAAHAYTFVEEVPENPCERARSFDPQDDGEMAQRARRACRLAVFEQRMTNTRREQVAAEQRAQEAAVERWLEKSETARVVHPMAIEGFAGSGIVNYGLTFSWNVLRQLELGAHLGQRQMSCIDQNFGTTADCTRTTWSLGVRWFLLDKDFSPFVGTGFSSTSTWTTAPANLSRATAAPTASARRRVCSWRSATCG
jgi:hypothetical protein